MSNLANKFSLSQETNLIRDKFLKWQCRVRQMLMRDNLGRPDLSIMPEVKLSSTGKTLGTIITVLSKEIAFSKLPEIQHIGKVNFDLSRRREKAIQFFSEYYFQKYNEFSGDLTATFQPGSLLAFKLIESGKCLLRFEAYNQIFNLICKVEVLNKSEHFYQATWWHNNLFNSSLHPETIILSFNADWSESTENIL